MNVVVENRYTHTAVEGSNDSREQSVLDSRVLPIDGHVEGCMFGGY